MAWFRPIILDAPGAGNKAYAFDTVTASSGTDIVASAGRNGRAGMRIPSGATAANATVNFSSRSVLLVGMAGKLALTGALGAAANRVWQLLDAGTVQLSVHLQSDGSIAVYRGTTTALLGQTAAGVFSPSPAYPFFGGRFKLSATVGEVQLYVGATQVLNLTGLNTIVTANAYATQCQWFPTASPTYTGDTCDFFLADDTGSLVNSWPGDVQITWEGVDGQGGSTGGTAVGAATRPDCVDDSPSVNVSDYVSYGAVSDENLWSTTNPPASITTVLAVAGVNMLSKADAGSASAKQIVRGSDGVTRSESADVTPTTSPIYYYHVTHTDPATGVAWTPSGLAAAQAGLRRTA